MPTPSSALPERPLIVVPAFNEAGVIGPVLMELATHEPHWPVLVVNDGSHDGTAAEAAHAGATVVSVPFNVGVGGAMRTGFLYALRNNFDAVVQVDADGQHDPAAVSALLAALSDADIVIGARFAGEGEYQVRGPRRWAMRGLAAVLSRITGTRLTDVTSGFRATGPAALPLFARDYPQEYLGDTVESLVLAHKAGLRIAQVPVAMRPRAAGQPSQSPLRATAYLLRASLVLLLAVVRRRPPMPSSEWVA
ncbi:MAG: glycosyltransferase family 2 protein [Actinomycetes bacterium]